MNSIYYPLVLWGSLCHPLVVEFKQLPTSEHQISKIFVNTLHLKKKKVKFMISIIHFSY